MKKLAISVLSAVLTAAMVLTMCITVAVNAASTDVDPKAIEKLVVDCRNAEAFAATSNIYEHKPTAAEPDPLTGGKYSFSSAMNAMEVEYNPNAANGNSFRVMPMFNKANTITKEYKYFVIVYAAKTAKPYKLSLWNSPRFGNEVVIAANGKDTNAKFVVSEPFDISQTSDANGRSILTRWVGTVMNTLSFITEDKDARFFIKEYAFFKTAEDAKTYYSKIDLNKSPSEYAGAPITVQEQKPTASQTSSSTLVNLSHITVEEPKVETTPTPTKEFDPVILSFAGEEAFRKNGKFNTFPENEEGKYEFVTLDDGTQCLKLNHYPFKNFAPYRMMATFNNIGVISSHHKYMRVTFMTTDVTTSKITLYNNKTALTTVIVPDTSYSRGEFVRSNAIEIGSGGYTERYTNMVHNTLGFTTVLDSADFYIKEIGFFTSEEQAYKYYGDSINADAATINFTEVRFGRLGNGTANRNEPSWGTSIDGEEALEITYCPSTNIGGVKYMSKIKPATKDITKKTQRFMRVLYSADNPDGVDKASMYLHCDKNSERVLVSDSIVDTNGKYVLTPAVYLTELMTERFSIAVHNSLIINAVPEGGKYNIKAVYFFDTRKEAEMFSVPLDEHSITIAGNDISAYKIVIDEEAPINVGVSANELALHIERLTGCKIPVVTDETAETDHEILIGNTNRAASNKYRDELLNLGDRYYRIYIDGNKLVAAATLGYGVLDAVSTLSSAVFYSNSANTPENIEIASDLSITALSLTDYQRTTFFEAGDPVENPVVFTEDFETDEGYFNEDQGETNWKYNNGAYVTNATTYASSYLHVYEKNVVYKAKLAYTAENNGCMGILARVNSEKSYVKAGYDFKNEAWYIESRGSADYYIERTAEAPAKLEPGKAYSIELTVYGDYASLLVDGVAVITDARLTHFSPGRLGIYAEEACVNVDDIEITLTSGQGTIIKNVHHTKFFTDTYLEGGTVTEMKDGSLIYSHHSGKTYVSVDNGINWTEREKWIDSVGYITVLRLNNGDLMQITRNADKTMVISRTSSDEGETWIDGGIICEGTYNNSTANAGNMNDKLMQTASGRLLFSQNYESATVKVDGRNVFCRYYFSDDLGKTWYKSETDSWEIAGNENNHHFGENKLLECADGTIRMYASWHPYGNIVYSDSTDGGKTFGPMQIMENMYCPQSSMQFVRDTYADNDTTYYMVWVNAKQIGANKHSPRSRLSLAKTTDGKNWVYLGDIWRWENDHAYGILGAGQINHVVDPFIKVTEDYLLVGSGFADATKIPNEGGAAAHMGQRQHVYSILKDTLPEGKPLN